VTGLVERDDRRAGAALLVALCARRVDEDAAHQPRGDCKEVRAVPPLHLLAVDQTDEDFADG
jgi:hypothetical protein